MALTKPSVLPVWGETNTTSADMVQPANSDIQTGWPLSSTPPSRQRFNWFMNYVMNAARYFARRGASDWDAAETYMTGDRIIGPDGLCYMSLQDTNLNKTPAAQPAWWLRTNLSANDIQNQAANAFDDTGAANAYVITPKSPITAYTAYQTWWVKIANTNTAGNPQPTMNISGKGNRIIVKESGDPFVGGELVAGKYYQFLDNGTNIVQVGTRGRTRLTANLDLYVSLTGNDSNFGLASGNPFLTMQKAYDFVAKSIDLNGFTVTLHHTGATGSYSAGISALAPLTGATATGFPFIVDLVSASVTVAAVNSSPFLAGYGAALSILSGTLTATGTGLFAGFGLLAYSGGRISYSGTTFGACAVAHVGGLLGSNVNSVANYTINGSSPYHWLMDQSSNFSAQSIAITLTGTPAFTTAFAGANDRSGIRLTSVSFVGSAANGTRAASSLNSVVQQGGATLPGNVNGTGVTGGQIA